MLVNWKTYMYIYIYYIYTHSNISTMNRFKRHVYIVYMAQVSEVADMPQNQPGRPPDLRSPYYNCYLGHSLCLWDRAKMAWERKKTRVNTSQTRVSWCLMVLFGSHFLWMYSKGISQGSMEELLSQGFDRQFGARTVHQSSGWHPKGYPAQKLF